MFVLGLCGSNSKPSVLNLGFDRYKERFRRKVFIRNKTQRANVRGNPLYEATKRHLNNNQTAKSDEK